MTLNDTLSSDALQVNDDVQMEPDGGARAPGPGDEPTGLTEEELEKYRDDPTWKMIRFASLISPQMS
ncbi:hypothetical protein Y032_0047g1479 [Ancylostoma ceylanicum]|uniref:Uncharacterized protein n=1 Tax=Ancylostoma ceylanicum TaxID=53326 RepID=A0A016UBX2_9BILA|nr:hypothetical protein Y032_0047g1479 [Ancylostoma ceylanicum]